MGEYRFIIAATAVSRLAAIEARDPFIYARYPKGNNSIADQLGPG
jgi:hypothetical protein